MNMHRTTVTKIESGARQVGSEVLRQWCELCHVDFELYEASGPSRMGGAGQPGAGLVSGLLPRPECLPTRSGTGTRASFLGRFRFPTTRGRCTKGRVRRRSDRGPRGRPDRPSAADHRAPAGSGQPHRGYGRSCAAPSRRVGRSPAQAAHAPCRAGRCKHIGIQVVPASRGANAGNVGAFTIASLDDADVMLMGAVEDVTTDKRPQ